MCVCVCVCVCVYVWGKSRIIVWHLSLKPSCVLSYLLNTPSSVINNIAYFLNI